MKRHLLEHFDHWDRGPFPAHEQEHEFFCACLNGQEKVVTVFPARPLVVRSECGVSDYYWVDAMNTWTFDASHRLVKPTDERVVAWLRCDDPMLTPDEMVSELEKAKQEIRYWHSRYTTLLSEMDKT